MKYEWKSLLWCKGISWASEVQLRTVERTREISHCWLTRIPRSYFPQMTSCQLIKRSGSNTKMNAREPSHVRCENSPTNEMNKNRHWNFFFGSRQTPRYPLILPTPSRDIKRRCWFPRKNVESLPYHTPSTRSYQRSSSGYQASAKLYGISYKVPLLI
jgi:hypothetical protein